MHDVPQLCLTQRAERQDLVVARRQHRPARCRLELLRLCLLHVGGVEALRQIASDTLQYRLTTPKIQSTARVSEGVPVALSRMASADDAARTCWVGAVPDNTSVQQVEEVMAQFGEIVDRAACVPSRAGAATLSLSLNLRQPR